MHRQDAYRCCSVDQKEPFHIVTGLTTQSRSGFDGSATDAVSITLMAAQKGPKSKSLYMVCIRCPSVRVVCRQVLHCVLYPRLEYDVPILSLDMVGNEAGGVSLAIVDVCPCVLEGHIPLAYREAARQALLASMRTHC